MTTSVDAIIDRLGGADAAARRLGVGTEALRKWRQNAAIPSRHWPALIQATGLALDDMPGAAPQEIPMPDPSAAPGATACLVLADGGGALGARLWRPRGRCRGRGLLQYRHDRLSGDADRPVLRRADHHLHLPAYRQRRRQSRGHRGDDDRRPRPGGEAGHHRALQLAGGAGPRCLAARAGRARDLRRRHARADHAHPRRRRAERRAGLPGRWPVRHRGPDRAGPGLAGAGRAGSREGRLLHAVLSLGRDALGVAGRVRPPGQAALSCRRGGLRRQAQHPALPGRQPAAG